MRLAVLLATAIALSATSPAAIAEQYDPYKVPKEVIAGRVDAIALWPVQVRFDGEVPDNLQTRVEEMVTAALVAKGYRVVPSEEYLAAWIEVAEKVGAVFDPVTGKPDEDKLATVRDFAGREMVARHGVDAVLFVQITPDSVRPWVQPRFMHPGEFHAIDQELVWQGRPLQAHPDNQPQSVSGTYLGVILEDLKGAQLYNIRAPIEYTRIYLLGSYEDVPRASLFRDQGRLQTALDKTLGPLVAPKP